MSKPSAQSASYIEHVAKLEKRLTTDDALRRAVGGEFLAVGKLEYHLLRSRGLRDDHFVVDVGCGSGRLACQLAPFPGIRYVGCDVVPRLLAYAGELCARPDWTFAPTDGAKIPCESGVADFVCFFSVFTHLHQEEIYRYFREAHRVLKPGGLLVMSFLEFRVAGHWAAFIASVEGKREDQHLNQFIERDAIHAWAAPAGFDVRSIHGGDTAYIPLPEEICYENGARVSGAGSLGQSVAVLQKRTTAPASTDAVAVAPHTAAARIRAETEPPASAPSAPLLNVSTRATLTPGGSATAGFIVGGSSPRRVLARAVGPGLSVFGVPHPLPRPALRLSAGDKVYGETSGGWGGDPPLAAFMALVGAFPLPAGSQDAALVATLPPGAYVAVAKSATPTDEGEVIIEIYLID